MARTVFFLYVIITTVACSPTPKELSSNHPASLFLEKLVQADTVELEALVVEGALARLQNLPKGSLTNFYVPIHTTALQRLQAVLEEQNHQVYVWEQAVKHFPEQVKKHFMNPAVAEEVVVILHQSSVIYLKMNGHKYHSIIPFSKGNSITSWL